MQWEAYGNKPHVCSIACYCRLSWYKCQDNVNCCAQKISCFRNSISFNHLLFQQKFEFLPNFKNPCWYEPLNEANVYQDNKYAVVSLHARQTMMELMQTWTNRLVKRRNARRLRCLPYFLMVGQPKCASTDMFKRITKHPDVQAPPIKELHWWSRNRQGGQILFRGEDRGRSLTPISPLTLPFFPSSLLGAVCIKCKQNFPSSIPIFLPLSPLFSLLLLLTSHSHRSSSSPSYPARPLFSGKVGITLRCQGHSCCVV